MIVIHLIDPEVGQGPINTIKRSPARLLGTRRNEENLELGQQGIIIMEAVERYKTSVDTVSILHGAIEFEVSCRSVWHKSS